MALQGALTIEPLVWNPEQINATVEGLENEGVLVMAVVQHPFSSEQASVP